MIRARRRPLSALYGKLNGKFFAGCLPRVSVRRVRDLRVDSWVRYRASNPGPYLASLFEAPLGTFSKEGIRVVAGYSPELERRILLHEMCHVAAWVTWQEQDHGPRFVAELLRLAALGEAWAAEEAERYATEAQALGVPVTALLE